MNGTLLYFRGRYNREAVIADLLKTQGLNTATTVIIAGCSAGGLAVYAAADAVRDMILAANPNALVVAMPGAGFFLDVASYNGNPSGGYGPPLARPLFEGVFNLMNVTSGLPSSCLEAFNSSQQFLCLYAQNLVETKSVSVPTFMSNSLVDEAQSTFIMNLGCIPSTPNSCNQSQVDYLNFFRSSFLNLSLPFLAQTGNGGFLLECFIHVIEDVDASWSQITIASQSQAVTFMSWLSGVEAAHSNRGSVLGGSSVLVDVDWDIEKGGNPMCNDYPSK